MPKANDSFTVTLSEPHIGWGTHRNTNTRMKRDGEAYIPISRAIATKFNITNSNHKDQSSKYTCNTLDGFLQNEILKASGCPKRGDIYAKQFAGSNNLKLLGTWFDYINAEVGTQIKITFTSPNALSLAIV